MGSAFGEHLHTLRRLWRHPGMGREALLEFQSRKLRSVARQAYANVAYWRRLFDRAGVKPEDIRGPDDLTALPITTRQDLLAARLADLLPRGADPKRLVFHLTSGSSGRPFHTYRGAFEEHLMNQFRLRALRQQGVRLRDRTASVAGGLDLAARAAGARLRDRQGALGAGPAAGEKHSLLSRARQGLGLYRRYWVSCQQEREMILAQLDRLRPDVVGGYPGVLAHVAPLLAEGRWPGIRPRLATTGGETLLPSMRRRIEQAFGARVFDAYGAHEANLLAWECPQTGLYHVCDDNVVLEVLCDGRPAAEGQRGLVVVTVLHAYAMPFLRLRLDDVATRGPTPCPCGQPFSTLRAIEGRMLDYFRLPDGRCPHPYDPLNAILLTGAHWIGQYQMIQERLDRIVFRVAPLHPPKPEELERAKQAGRLCFGPEVDFRVEIVDQIPFEPGGKFRVSHSALTSDYEGFDWEGAPSCP